MSNGPKNEGGMNMGEGTQGSVGGRMPRERADTVAVGSIPTSPAQPPAPQQDVVREAVRDVLLRLLDSDFYSEGAMMVDDAIVEILSIPNPDTRHQRAHEMLPDKQGNENGNEVLGERKYPIYDNRHQRACEVLREGLVDAHAELCGVHNFIKGPNCTASINMAATALARADAILKGEM